LQVRNLKKKFI